MEPKKKQISLDRRFESSLHRMAENAALVVPKLTSLPKVDDDFHAAKLRKTVRDRTLWNYRFAMVPKRAAVNSMSPALLLRAFTLTWLPTSAVSKYTCVSMATSLKMAAGSSAACTS